MLRTACALQALFDPIFPGHSRNIWRVNSSCYDVCNVCTTRFLRLHLPFLLSSAPQVSTKQNVWNLRCFAFATDGRKLLDFFSDHFISPHLGLETVDLNSDFDLPSGNARDVGV